MALEEDSAVVVFRATGDGYFVSVYQYDVSPPPPSGALASALENPQYVTSFRVDRVAADKTELISEVTNWINSIFDQP